MMPYLITRRHVLASAAGVVSFAGSSDLFAGDDSPAIGIGFSLYGMKTLPLSKALEACREIGYDCVELPLMPGWPADPEKLAFAAKKELKADFEKTGLRLSALMENLSLLAEGKSHDENLRRLKTAAEFARELSPDKPPIIETVLGGRPEDWDAVNEKMAERLREWAKVAEEKKVVIAIKAHVANALHTPADAAWLLEQVGSQFVRLAFDYSHFKLQKNIFGQLTGHFVATHRFHSCEGRRGRSHEVPVPAAGGKGEPLRRILHAAGGKEISRRRGRRSQRANSFSAGLRSGRCGENVLRAAGGGDEGSEGKEMKGQWG